MSNINQKIKLQEAYINRVGEQINQKIDANDFSGANDLVNLRDRLYDDLIDLDTQKIQQEQNQQAAVLRSYNQLNQPSPDYSKPNEGLPNVAYIPHAGMWAAPAAVWGGGIFGMLRAFFF